MNFILFHKGKCPVHLYYCIKQIYITQPNARIYLLTDDSTMLGFKDTFNLNDYTPNDLQSIGYYTTDHDPLWRTSFERFFYIRNFLAKHDITENIIHFDNDVLVYENIENIKDRLIKYVDHIGITPHKDNEFVCGFMYIKKAISLHFLCDELLSLAKKGEKQLEKELGSMPHEMRLLGEIGKMTSLITPLPVSPLEPGNNNFDIFNGVFDPSTYGQYIGGTHSGQGQDKETVHLKSRERFIDRHVNENFKPYFDSELKRPYLLFNGKKIIIYNLHVHSKNLKDYISWN